MPLFSTTSFSTVIRTPHEAFVSRSDSGLQKVYYRRPVKDYGLVVADVFRRVSTAA